MFTVLKPKNKLSRPRRVAILVILLILVLGTISVIFYPEHFKLGSILRWYNYHFLKSNFEESTSFSHNAQAEDLFLTLDDNLLVCTDKSIQLFSKTGTPFLEIAVPLSTPALSTAGKHAVVYEANGQELRVISNEKLAFSLTLSEDQSILSATINDRGWLAVTTKEDGYKGIVTVYDDSYEPLVAIRLSSRYLSDAVVTPDCKGLFAISPGQYEGTFENTLLFYSLSQCDNPTSECSFGNSVALSLCSAENHCWILGENHLSIFSSSGELSGQYEYNGKYLKKVSLSGNNFATLLFSNSQTGTTGSLVVISTDGKIIGELELLEQVLALKASGRYVAVLTSSSLHIYEKNLTELCAYQDVQGVRQIALFPDGSVRLITDDHAKLYLPE